MSSAKTAISLQSLTLQNFRGVRSFTLHLDGRNATVRGRNGSGKTTLADAWSWLLTGRDSKGAAEFAIKPLLESGEALHSIEYAVEAAIKLDGVALKLRRAYSEKWTKKKGSPAAEFTGHQTNFFVDDVPVQEKDWQARLAVILPLEAWPLLLSPTYFAQEMHWEKRRRLLLDVCGDVQDADVIASSPELAPLADVLASGKSPEEVVKQRKAEGNRINKQLLEIPARIDEATLALPDTTGLDAAVVFKATARTKDLLAQAQARLAVIHADGGLAGKGVELANAKAALQAAHNGVAQIEAAAKAPHRKALMEASAALENATADAKVAARRIETLEAEAATLEGRMAKLREEWQQVNAAEPLVAEVADACPTCGTAFPASQVQELAAKALADANEQKAERLAAIQEQGRAHRAVADKIKLEIEGAKLKRAAAEGHMESARAQGAAAQAELKAIADNPVQSVLVGEAELRIAKIEEEIAAIKAGGRDALETATAHVAAIEQELANLQAQAAAIESLSSGKARVAELGRQQKALASEYEAGQRDIYLCEQFAVAKCAMLSDKINGRFKFATFSLFTTLINEGIKPECRVMHNGVGWSDLNTAARHNLGVDCVNTLAEHFGVTLPLFCDQAESVTAPLATVGQRVRLMVDAKAAKLTVELE